MDELEQLFRESFERHADEVDTAIEVPTRKRQGWAIPLLATAAAITVVASGGLLLGDDKPDSGIEPGPAVVVPADWRLEQWHGVQVSVPPDWGWGGAPLADNLEGRGAGRYLDCGASAFVDASGKKLLNGDRGLPYVGRPQYMTDMCTTYVPDRPPMPTVPYVWLGAPLDEGIRDLGDGWVQETVKVAGEAVTVATRDETLRRRVLASAGPVQGACAATLPADPQPVGDLPDIELPTSMTVCAYDQTGESPWQLVYSTSVGPDPTATFVNALPDHTLPGAGEPGTNEIVVLHVGPTQLVVRLSSFSTIELRGVYGLTPETVRPWAVDGIPAYVTGPIRYTPELSPYFRGMLG